MAIKRIVDTKFWEDEKVINDFSPEDKYFFLYLLTNPRTTLLGVYRFVPKQAAFELGYSVDAVNTLLDRFENKYKTIRYNRQTSEIAIRNYLRYGIVSGGRPVMDMLVKTASDIVDKSLIEFVKGGAAGREKNDTVRKFLTEYETPSPTPLTPDGNGNGNGNGNGDGDGDGESYHDSYHDSYHESSPTQNFNSKVAKIRHGAYRNVLLSQTELDKLKQNYPDYAARVERLSEYMESKGAKYKNHYATIVSWAKKDKEKGKETAAHDAGPNWAYDNV